MSVCVSLETCTKEGTRPGEMNLIRISTAVSFEVLSSLCFLKERRLRKILTLGGKLTVEAYEEDRKPLKARKSSQGCR